MRSLEKIILGIVLVALCSCRTFLPSNTFFLPDNITEQLQFYFEDDDSKYLVFPVYASRTPFKELNIGTPFFIANLSSFSAIQQKFNEAIKCASERQLTFFFFEKTGKLTAVEIPSVSIIKDYSICVYKSIISRKWKDEIRNLILNREMPICTDSWIYTPFYHYYAHGCLLFSLNNEISEYERKILIDFFDSIEINNSIMPSWKCIFNPIGKKHLQLPASLLDKKNVLTIEELMEFDDEYNQLYKVNGHVISGKGWFGGKISPNILSVLESEKPDVIIYSECAQDYHVGYDCIRHYAIKNRITFFYLDSNSGVYTKVLDYCASGANMK